MNWPSRLSDRGQEGGGRDRWCDRYARITWNKVIRGEYKRRRPYVWRVVNAAVGLAAPRDDRVHPVVVNRYECLDDCYRRSAGEPGCSCRQVAREVRTRSTAPCLRRERVSAAGRHRPCEPPMIEETRPGRSGAKHQSPHVPRCPPKERAGSGPERVFRRASDGLGLGTRAVRHAAGAAQAEYRRPCRCPVRVLRFPGVGVRSPGAPHSLPARPARLHPGQPLRSRPRFPV